MDNIITFELPANEYRADISYTSAYNYSPSNINFSSLKNPEGNMDYSSISGLAFLSCFVGVPYLDVSLSRIEIDNKSDNPTINVEFQARTEIDIQAIKDKIKNCGFKIK